MSGLVKHYQNTMQGIPQLSNNWGAMINLLDAVLVAGFNHIPVLSLTKSSTTAITATINLGGGHGFIDRQVVRIAGSTNGWDGDYKVLSADGASITVECTTEHPITISGTATCFTAPLDFEIVHQTSVGSIEPKRAYRSTNPDSLGLILLVHDFCVLGAAATGAKFAKVGVVSEMADIHTITGSQMPFNPDNPEENWGWDGVRHGLAKWYYRAGGSSDVGVPLSGDTPFCLVGNSKSFALETNQGAPLIYGFFEFHDVGLHSSNVCLLAQGLQGSPGQAESINQALRTAYHFSQNTYSGLGSDNINLRGIVWLNNIGINTPTRCGPALNICNASPDAPEKTNLLVASPLPVTLNNGMVVGSLPFLKMSASMNNGVFTSAQYGKYITRYFKPSFGLYVKYALTLESE